MDDSRSLDALRARFLAIGHRATPLSAADSDSLRQMVCAAVRDLRDRGAPPERVIVMVRQLAEDAGVRVPGHPRLDRVVEWCIEEYYAAPDSSDLSRRLDVGWVAGNAEPPEAETHL